MINKTFIKVTVLTLLLVGMGFFSPVLAQEEDAAPVAMTESSNTTSPATNTKTSLGIGLELMSTPEDGDFSGSAMNIFLDADVMSIPLRFGYDILNATAEATAYERVYNFTLKTNSIYVAYRFESSIKGFNYYALGGLAQVDATLSNNQTSGASATAMGTIFGVGTRMNTMGGFVSGEFTALSATGSMHSADVALGHSGLQIAFGTHF